MEPTVCRLDLQDVIVARQVLVLQHSAYRVEADLIGFEQIPPLHESLQDLVSAPLSWLGIVDGHEVVAALAFTAGSGGVDIDRLVVAPAFARRGYGTALVSELGVTATITVATGTKNLPAHRLYESLGFVNVGETSPVAGLQVTHFERKATHGPR